MHISYPRRSAILQTVEELCADAHYYFAHSFNSPWGTKATSICRTYTLSHQGLIDLMLLFRLEKLLMWLACVWILLFLWYIVKPGPTPNSVLLPSV